MAREEVEHDVHVMARLLEDHGTRLVAVRPVSPDEGVCHVPVGDVLRQVDHRDLSKHAIRNRPSYRAEEWRVAQHMAHSHVYTGPLGRLGDRDAIILAVRHGLLEEDLVAKLHRFQRRLPVHVVERAYEDAVCDSSLCKSLPPVAEAVAGFQAISPPEGLTPRLVRLCDGDDPELVRMGQTVVGIGAAPRAGSKHKRTLHKIHGGETIRPVLMEEPPQPPCR